MFFVETPDQTWEFGWRSYDYSVRASDDEQSKAVKVTVDELTKDTEHMEVKLVHVKQE